VQLSKAFPSVLLPCRGHTKEQLAHLESNCDPSMQGPPCSLLDELSLDDFIPYHLRAYVGSSSRGTRVSGQ
jgi:hypothetical protein